MKLGKSLVWALITAILLTSFPWTADAAEEISERKSLQIRKTAVPPVIDGLPSETLWQVNTPVDVRFEEGNEQDAWFGVLWDNQYLYVAVSIEDEKYVHNAPGSWFEQDSVSLFLDPTHHRSAPFTENDLQIGLVYQPNTTTPSFYFGSAPNHASKDENSILRAIQTTDFGWTAEIAIPWDMLQYNPLTSQTLGFEIGVTDRDDPSTSPKNSYWSAYNSVSFWNDTTGYGDLLLSQEIVAGDADDVLLNENFEGYAMGETPQGWISSINGSSPEFTVVEDTYGNKRLQFDGSSAGQQSRIVAPVQWDNYTIEADVRFESVLNSARWAALMFRAPSSGDAPYNQMAVRQNGTYEIAYRDASNNWAVPESGSWGAPLELGKDYTMKVRVFGRNIKEYIKAAEDEQYTLLTDRTLPTELLVERGKVGFQADQSKVSFDNLKVTRISVDELHSNLPQTVEALTGPFEPAFTAAYSDGVVEAVYSDGLQLHSSNEEVLKIVDNQLYPMQAGTVTLTAVYYQSELTTEITVTPSTQGPAVIELSHEPGYILATVGESVSLNSIEFHADFNDFTTGTVKGTDVEWQSAHPEVQFTEDTMTVSKAGVFTVNAISQELSIPVMIVARADAESEYVLYEQSFDQLTSGQLPDEWSVIEGSASKISVVDGSLVIDASAAPNNPSRVLLPAYLGQFGNYNIEADVTHLAANESTRWNSIMFRVQNDNYPYYQMAVRQNATPANGVEFAVRTPANQWHVPEKGAYSEVIDANKMYRYTIQAYDHRVREWIDDELLIDTDLASDYGAGRIGLQANGSIMKVDNIRVTLRQEALPEMPSDRFVQVTEPQSTVPLAPSIITEAEHLQHMIGQETPFMPATVIFRINEELSIIDRTGSTIGNLKMVLPVVADQIIPAIYVRTEAETDAAVQFLKHSQIEDAFIISADGNLVKRAREAYPILRGVVEFQVSGELTEEQLMDIRRTTNSSLAKIAQLPKEAATREQVSYLQMRLITVWAAAQEASDPLSIHELLTAGVNGIVTPSPEGIYNALDVYNYGTTLLRRPLVIGHRGIPALAPENTLEGAKVAYANGSDIIENDIYITKDGHIVIMHDATLDRTTNGTGNVEDYTLAQLQNILANDQFPAEYPTAKIPTLEQFFDEFKHTELVHFVEIKSYKPEIVDALIELIQEKDIEDQVVVISFSADQLKRLGEKMPGMSLGFLTGGIANEDKVLRSLREALKTVQPLNATFNTSYGGLGEQFMEAAKHRGLTIWPWTYRNQDDYIKYFLDGTYGLTTDYAHWSADWAAELIPSSESLNLSTQESVDISAKIETYKREQQEIKPEIVLLDGKQYVQVSDSTVTGVTYGTAHALLRYTQTLENGASYDLYSKPIAFHVQGSSETLLKLSGPAQVSTGDTFTLSVDAQGAKDLYGTVVKIAYDPSQLKVVDTNAAAPGTQVSISDWLGGTAIANEADHAEGTVTFGVTKLGREAGVSGEGQLAEITFAVLAPAGETVQIGFVNEAIQMTNSRNEPISFQTAAYSAPIVDLPMIQGSVEVDPSQHLNDLSGFTVILEKEHSVIDQTVTDTQGGYTFITPEAGSYNIKVSAVGYLGAEAAVAVSSGEDVNVPAITMIVGDFDGSGKIDILDISLIARSYLQKPEGHAAMYDVDRDGDIDLYDIVSAALHFGVSK
ncbi:glycerophosphodiester phosphodiesterase family protein [Marinicrinis lubricantis]|uniref:Glycerophosphodiester phosphodiesterase family protein n=1 Tax=Marinicrinis lubricantis TaxID=2086470 RepID=A0ABW1IRR8_9BACL